MVNERGYLRSINAKRAALWYRQPSKSLHLVLVTGEAGKSTTALFLYHILQADNRNVAVFTNIVSYIGDDVYHGDFGQSANGLQSALSIAKKAGCDFVIIEMTPFINLESTLRTLHYNSIIATTTSPDLTKLFDRETEFVALPYAVDPITIPLAPHQIAYFGRDAAADIYIDDIKQKRGGTEIDVVLDHHHHYALASYLLGTLNVMNIAAAIAMAYILGVPIEAFAEGVARLEQMPANLEKLALDAPYNVYLDSAKSAESASSVVETLNSLKKRRLLVALSSELPLDLANDITNIADQVTVYGGDSVDGHLVLAKDRDHAIDTTLRGARLDDSVLFLGRDFTSRDMEGNLEIYSTIKGTRFNEDQSQD